MRPHLFKTLAAAAVALGVPAAGANPNLQIDSTTGLVTGATGVSVGAALLNVQFMSGNCQTIFPGSCGVSGQPFFFTSSASAVVASQAILDLGPMIQNATSSVAAINGCIAPGALLTTFASQPVEPCQVLTPFHAFPGGAGLSNVSFQAALLDPGGDSGVIPGTIASNQQTGSGQTFAVWTDAPEPASIAIAGAAAAGLVAARRKKRSVRRARKA